MTKEEYLSKKEKLKEEICNLTAEYVKSNSPIPNNTKVKITRVDFKGNKIGVDYGFLVGYHCSFGNVEPIIKKLKKDGSVSVLNYWCTNMDNAIIEKCE